MRRPLSLAAVLLLLAAPGAARTDDAAALVLTLDEALELAARQSRIVLQAGEYRAGVEAAYREQFADALPQLALSGYASRSDDASQAGLGPPERTDSYGVKLGVTQPLYTAGKLGAAIKAADIGRSTAADRLASAQADALRDTAVAFYGVLLARELEGLAAQNLKQKGRHLEEAKRRLAAGTATDYDVLAASVAEQNARPELISAANRVLAARERLAFVLGVQGREVDAAGSLDAGTTHEASATPDAAAALQAGIANRPDLVELRKERAIADELVRIARAGKKPHVSLAADAGWAGVDLDGATGDGRAWSAAVNLTWPLFDGGRTGGAVAGAESDARRLALDEGEFLQALSLDARTGADVVVEAAGIVEALGGTVAQAERLLAMAEKGFEFGVKTRLDVDDAQLNLLQARAGLARGRHDLLVARVRLRWVMGTLTAGR